MTKKTQRARARAEKKPRIGEEHIRPDGSVIRYVREEDDDRKPVDHYRTVDTLALMLRNGSITGAMHDAGQQFSQDFARAFGSGVASPKLDGLPGGTAPGQMMVEKNEAKGILVAALGVLARYYGYERAPKAQSPREASHVRLVRMLSGRYYRGNQMRRRPWPP